MSELSIVQRGLTAAGAAMTALMLTSACEAAPIETPAISVVSPSSSPTVETKSRNMVDVDKLPLGAATMLDIYPVSLDIHGLTPIIPSTKQIKYIFTKGWSDLEVARGHKPNVTAQVNPIQRVELPGVVNVPDICNDDVRGKFRNQLLAAVLPNPSSPRWQADRRAQRDPGQIEKKYDKTIPIVVIEQDGLQCVLADASEGGAMVVYIGSQATVSMADHELGHWAGAGHDSTLKKCNRDVTPTSITTYIGTPCRVDEYGSPFTEMGSEDNALRNDRDIYSAYGELRMGGVTFNEVYQVDPGLVGEQTFDLSSLENADGGKKAVRIPIQTIEGGQKPVIGTAEVGEGKDKKEVPVYASAAYIELSGAQLVYDNDGKLYEPLSVKIYLVDESQGLANTYLLPMGSKDSYDISAGYLNKLFTFEIGDTYFSFRVNNMSDMGHQVGTAQVGVMITPSKK